MAIDKSEFLEFANNLPAINEINNRNAISRAYYAAFHYCNEAFYSNRQASGGVHARLIDGLIKSTNSADRQIGYILQDIRNRRTIADYELTHEVTPTDRETTIKLATKLIKQISTLQP